MGQTEDFHPGDLGLCVKPKADVEFLFLDLVDGDELSMVCVC